MKRLLCLILCLTMSLSICAASVSAAKDDASHILFDDFLLEGTPVAIDNMVCVETEYDSLTDNSMLRTKMHDFDVWMLRDSVKPYGLNTVEYNMIPSERNKDASLTYYNENFGGKLFAVTAGYRDELVQSLAGGDWYDWKAFYNGMPYKLYAGPTQDSMVEITPTHFRTAAWYPDNYLEYIVDELPADTKYVKVTIPGLDSEDYDKRKIIRVVVTEDTTFLNEAYVNPYIPYTADEAADMTFSRFFVNGTESYTLANGSVYGKASIQNERSGAMNATLFTALYKNGALYDVKSDTREIKAFQTVIFSTENNPMTIPEGENVAEFDARLWVVTDNGEIGKSVTIAGTEHKPEYVMNDFPMYDIHVISPEYRYEISGDTLIKFAAPGFESVTISCYKQSGDGVEDVVVTVPVDATGYGEYLFPADEFPYGPITIRIEASIYDEWEEEYIERALNMLQVYNLGGVPFQQGLEAAPVNPVVTENNLKLVFEDDFEGELSIGRWDTSKTYSSHKITFGDYSGLYFRDYEDENLNPFFQVDTYMKIQANEAEKSAGLISTMHQDRETGVQCNLPAYYECRFICQYATGTWPAFWFVNNNDPGQPGDELDPIEAYGFDSYNDHYDHFHAGHAEWGRDSVTFPEDEPGKMINMRKMSDGSSWFERPHTYAMYMGEEWTIFYLDNEEMYRFHTTPSSKIWATYPMFNLAVGGSSGWPIDLSKYDGIVDMYVDWIRIYAAE